jgi:hypothetical protein
MATYRVVFLDDDGVRCERDFKSAEELVAEYEQIGIEEDSYALRLHGEPQLKGLIGPLSEGKSIIRYETPAVFVTETEEWAKQKRPPRN